MRSLLDMTSFFEQIDEHIRNEPMPPDHNNKRSMILCNDCGEQGEVKCHFEYHKCTNVDCGSYNTNVLYSFDVDSEAQAAGPEPVDQAPSQQLVVGSSNSQWWMLCRGEYCQSSEAQAKSNLCHNNLITPYMREQMLRLQNNVSDLLKMQYDRLDRQGNIVTHQQAAQIASQQQPILGCKHYARNYKLKAKCSGLFVSCRLCHDELLADDHGIDRFATV